MYSVIRNMLAVIAILMLVGRANAVDITAFEELVTIIDSARVLEVSMFAPKSYDKAIKAYVKAREAVQSNKKQKTVDKHVSKSREYIENSLRATGVARLSLQEYLPARQKARDAMAPSLVPNLFKKAEMQFLKATTKIESGDVKGALKEAAKALPLYDRAELEGIRADILGKADRLIEKALADGAGKFALTTMDKARGARIRANTIIEKDRYNRKEAIKEAKQAAYEARHASTIGLSVRSLKRNDQAWEKLMMVYEIQMNRVGEAAGMQHLPFDNGPLAAADTLIGYIKDMQHQSQNIAGASENLSYELSTGLRGTLEQMGESSDQNDPAALAKAVDAGVSELIDERDVLKQKLADHEAQLAELSKVHNETAMLLQTRMEREEKFKKAKNLLNPSEGEVLFNSSNDIILRLSGLSFTSGKSDIKDEHIALLTKVQQVIEMFPEAILVIEGHTDATGEASANVLLSEKRAFAVMQYLRQSMLISASRISSIGYGADKPVASNQTADGRSKNRRIDVLVMR